MAQRTTEEAPVISVMSGKGGVGKTQIAVNLARVLAMSNLRVLLIDMDFYNRGATALLVREFGVGTGTSPKTMYSLLRDRLEESPDDSKSSGPLLEESPNDSKSSSPLIEAHINSMQRGSLVILPSTPYRAQLDYIEFRHSTEELAKALKAIIKQLTQQNDIDVIVADCKAGPDPFTVAISGISTRTLIVAERDRITWDGTLNLYSYIVAAYRERQLAISFILNKLPRQYDPDKMSPLYAQLFADMLSGLSILQYIPFSDSVFETYGNYSFVVDELPRSVFSRKIVALLDDLKNDIPKLRESKHESRLLQRIRMGRSSNFIRILIELFPTWLRRIFGGSNPRDDKSTEAE